MLVIQHRSNFLTKPVTSNVAEIDVHLNIDDGWGVKHGATDSGWKLGYYLEKTKHDKFFVDIKQNLEVKDYKQLVEIFGNRLVGLFDVPFPSCFFAAQEGLPVYRRISEYEHNNMCIRYTRFWLDPLVNWSPENYASLIRKNIMFGNIMIACPSLHGQSKEVCEKLWKYIAQRKDVEGIVTKHIEDCEKVVNENS